jgi:hypothetical protein
MLDYQRIVEEIQAALASTASIDWDLLRDCAAEYAAATDEVNVRLEECGHLLKRGLRSEAIQLAERVPNLLDAAAQLDFPELDQWQQLLAANGMVLPPLLRVEVATELNSAYAVEAPLQSLLKNHRLLALARAPLGDRIQVLRMIHRADPDNPLWADDLKMLELYRVQQIERESESAVTSRDAAALGSLLDELTGDGWSIAPRTDMVEKVHSAHQRVVAQHARDEMPAVLERLRRAYDEYDVPGARQARQQWATLCELARVDGRHPLLQEAQVALDWLDQQEQAVQRKHQHAAALHELERALDNDAPRNQLERLMLAVERTEDEIPAPVLMRYGERMRLHEVTGRRKFTLRVAAVLGLLLIIAGATAWAIVRRQHERQVAQAAKSLGDLVKQERLVEAEDFLAQLEQTAPAIATRTEIQEPAARLAVLVAAETQRAERFARLMTEIESKGPASFLRSSFLEARELAQTLDEKARAADWESRTAEYERSRRREREESFRGELEALVNLIEALEKSAADQGEEQFTAANAKVKQLNGELALVSAELGGQLQPLAARLGSLARRLSDRRSQEVQLRKLHAAVGDEAQYRQELLAFVQKFPDAALSGEFRRVAADADLWSGAAAWNKFYSSPLCKDLLSLTPEQAQQLLDLSKPLVAEHGSLPQASAWQARVAHVEAVAARVDDQRRFRSQELRKLFDDPLLKGMHCVTTVSGERYYVKNPLTAAALERGPKVTLKYLGGFDFSEKSTDLLRESIARHGPAPQQRLAATVHEALDDVEKGKWDAGFFTIIVALLDKESDLDPVLRLVLLKRTIDVAQQGSRSLRVACQEMRQRLEDRRTLLSANWLDPLDANVQSARDDCQKLLAEFGDVNQLRAKAKEVFRADTQSLPGAPRWVGWLMRDADQYQLMTTQQESTGALYVLYRDGGGSVQWSCIGQAARGKVTWSAGDAPSMVAGRPLFLHGEAAGAAATSATARR